MDRTDGYAARGLVYLLAGSFSLLARTGGDSVGPKGALNKIIGWPFGETLVYAIAAGLVCFAGWRTVQAIYDPDRFTSGPSSLLRRVFVYGGSAAIHLGLAAMAINLALAARATDEDRQARDWTAWCSASRSAAPEHDARCRHRAGRHRAWSEGHPRRFPLEAAPART